MTRAGEYTVTVRIAARDLPKLAGHDVVAIEETMPGGWTRRLPEPVKQDLRPAFKLYAGTGCPGPVYYTNLAAHRKKLAAWNERQTRRLPDRPKEKP